MDEKKNEMGERKEGRKEEKRMKEETDERMDGEKVGKEGRINFFLSKLSPSQLTFLHTLPHSPSLYQ